MKNLLVLTAFFSLFIISTVSAQKDRTLFNSGAVNITGAWGGSQTAITGFNGEYGALNGGFGGVELNKNLLIGGGGLTSVTYNGIDQIGDTYEMSYGGLVVGYGLKSHKIIHPQATILLGGGWQQEANVGRDNVFVVQPAIGAEINVFRWFRVGLHGGYRMAINEQFNATNDTFSGTYGSISFKFGWSWGR